MANEILAMPEESLDEVIKVIRTGLEHVVVAKKVRKNLLK